MVVSGQALSFTRVGHVNAPVTGSSVVQIGRNIPSTIVGRQMVPSQHFVAELSAPTSRLQDSSTAMHESSVVELDVVVAVEAEVLDVGGAEFCPRKSGVNSTAVVVVVLTVVLVAVIVVEVVLVAVVVVRVVLVLVQDGLQTPQESRHPVLKRAIAHSELETMRRHWTLVMVSKHGGPVEVDEDVVERVKDVLVLVDAEVVVVVLSDVLVDVLVRVVVELLVDDELLVCVDELEELLVDVQDTALS